jgi:hypothetical protein
VYLIGVYLTDVHLIGAYLIGVYLIGVYLMSVYLISVYLMGVYLINGHLIGVYLTGVHLMEGVELDWNVLPKVAIIMLTFAKDLELQGAATTPLDEYILALKKGVTPLAWPLERIHLYNVCRDHSWSVRVCIKVA